MIMERINEPGDLQKLNLTKEELDELAQEIREFLIDKISITGGHLASNLGTVELTLALHLAFQIPKDKIIWDVGHQSYTHKILTGRKEGFDTLRQLGGMSGFPKMKESPCDAFNTGHSTTSISVGLGMAYARDIKKEDYSVISVIGDGALTGGMAYEALNNAAQLESNFIIVLNDNDMSISKNVGGVSAYLESIRTDVTYNNLKEDVSNTLSKIPVVGERIVQRISKTKSTIKQFVIPGMLFENMGITYLGPIDGHDINQLIRVFSDAKRLKRAVIVHVRTQKGKGYEPAVKNPAKFHGIAPFDIATGLLKQKKTEATYTDIFARMLCNIAAKDDTIVGITAAMPDGTGMKRFAKEYPERFFDVGIAEEHAVTFAAGLAASGLKPVVAIYSSFLQRAYDQIIHDVCINDLPVIFAIDRAGLVGNDGETHQGVFDFSYMSSIPGMTIFAPKNKYEFMDGMDFAASYSHPIAIRYPRGTAYTGLKEHRARIELGKSELLQKGKEIALLAIGTMVQTAMEVAEKLKQEGYEPTVINMRFVQPWDKQCVDRLSKTHKLVVTMEENVLSGGMGEKIAAYISAKNYSMQVLMIGVPNEFIEHGTISELKQILGMDRDGIFARIKSGYGKYLES